MFKYKRNQLVYFTVDRKPNRNSIWRKGVISECNSIVMHDVFTMKDKKYIAYGIKGTKIYLTEKSIRRREDLSKISFAHLLTMLKGYKTSN